MRIFVDSANLADIESALQRGFVAGITTNPSILSKEQRRDFNTHIRDIISLLRRYDSLIPLSVEVFTTDPHEMLAQVEEVLRHQRGTLDRLHQLWIEYAQVSGQHAPQ